MPLAVGSTLAFVALTFFVPAVLAALLPIRARWIVAVGLALAAAATLSAIPAEEEPHDFGPVATAIVMFFLLLVWSAGVAAGRLLAKTVFPRR